MQLPDDRSRELNNKILDRTTSRTSIGEEKSAKKTKNESPHEGGRKLGFKNILILS